MNRLVSTIAAMAVLLLVSTAHAQLAKCKVKINP